MKRLLLLIFFITINVDLGSALRCYSCNATVGYRTACEGNVKNRTTAIIACGQGYTKCMTLVANRTITRACSLPNVCSTLRNYTRCSTCSYSLCNSAGFIPSYSTTIGLPIAMFIILKLSF